MGPALALGVFLFARGALADDFVSIDVAPNGTAAFGVNSLGWVVGDYSTNRNMTNVRGFLWKDGAVTLIDYPLATNTRPMGINDAGDIVGWWGTGLHQHGFLLRDGVYTTFDVPDSVFTDPKGIANNGDIVGGYCAQTTWDNKCDWGPGSIRGFLLRDGVFTTIVVPGAVYTEAWATNGDQIAGRYADADGVFHAFRLTLATGETVTIDVPGAAATSSDWWGFGGGIDAAGDVLGSFCSFEPCTIDNDALPIGWQYESNDFHGYLWSTDDGSIEQIDLDGAILTAAFSISASGEYIAGTWFDVKVPSGGGEHGYLLRRSTP